jgi:hypothetical protein
MATDKWPANTPADAARRHDDYVDPDNRRRRGATKRKSKKRP